MSLAPSGPQGAPPRGEAALLALCALVFAALAGARAFGHAFPVYDDTAFLLDANLIRELGGPLALLRALFEGTWTEANRHPLYPALLSLLGGRDLGFHARAQALQVALGVGALLVSWRVARRHLGPRAALWFAALLAVSNTLVEYASREACEPLLVIAWALAVCAFLDSARRPWRLVAAGAWAGAAMLVKGSGLVLGVTFALALFLQRGAPAPGARGFDWRRALGLLRAREAWLALAAFAAVASPVLVRNLRVFGSPTYNFNNRYFWIDKPADAAEFMTPRAFERLPHGALEYLQQLTPAKLAFRLAEGPAGAVLYLGDALSFAGPGPLHALFVVLGLGGAALAALLLWRAPRDLGRTFLLVQLVLWEALAAAYSAAGQSARYVLPMSLGLWAALAAAAAARRLSARTAGLALGGVAALALALGPRARALPPGFAETQGWLQAHLAPGEGFAIDGRSKLQPGWSIPARPRQEIVATTWHGAALPAAELLAWFAAKDLRWVVADASSECDGTPRYFFHDLVRLEPDGALPLAGWPAGLRVAWAAPGRRYLVLERRG